MEILYFGSYCEEEWSDSVIKNSGLPFKVAQYSFEKAFINGVIELKDVNMQIYYLNQEPYYPRGTNFRYKSRSTIINEKMILHHLSNINYPFIKELISFLQGIGVTLRWFWKNRMIKEKVVLTPFNYTPLSLGIYLTAKLFRIKRVNIFTDLSGHILTSTRQKNMIWFKKAILPLYYKLVQFVENQFDGYILFTKPMNRKVNPLGRPYIVMEGIFNNDLDLSSVTRSKAIMYAGTLSYEYGIKNILDAFNQIEDQELELWIFGDGDMREYIEKLSLSDRRIKYFGFKPRNIVFEYEKRAQLLINARNPKDEYTHFSFPSKTFEYMVSGTPFLTTKIPCIPDEYHKYLYFVEYNNIVDLKNKMIEILNKPKQELEEFGDNARRFILQNKNSLIQSKKIIEMIKCKVLTK
ncbi:glycosyltransferase [Bacillus massilinigeriensis]|uniref:glycosyltransferase n=1 Tax=Bacillus massilionigeriensis TaxID=1805475 RepID=UPI00096AFAE0|nr:glycosyltransferase [Bacillus massilionigeriensis]